MASMFARSSRSKDEDDLRKDHRKRKIGHQIEEDVEDFEAGKYHPPKKLSDLTTEVRHEEAMKAFKTRPGGKGTKKDINLPDPLKGKHVADIDFMDYKDPKTGEVSRISRQIKGGDPDDPRWETKDDRLPSKRTWIDTKTGTVEKPKFDIDETVSRPAKRKRRTQ